MTLRFTSPSIAHQIEVIARSLGGEASRDCQIYTIDLPPHLGEGRIIGQVFDDGLGVLLADFTLYEPVEQAYEPQMEQALHFQFCLQGEVLHTLDHGRLSYSLHALKGSISANPRDSSQNLFFPKNTRIQHANLVVYRSEYLQRIGCTSDQLHPQLATLFEDQAQQLAFLHEGSYNVPAAACITELMAVKYGGLIGSLYNESKALELLALQLQQYEDDIEATNRPLKLKPADLDRILAAERILTENLQDAPTIVELAKQSGINQQKLKQGFKKIFQKTINQYLRDKRLETSRQLLEQGSASIHDIAEQVGYNNPGHFARRFKEKYGLLPKEALRGKRS